MPLSEEEIIQKYIKRYGRNKTPGILNMLGKERPFIEAISTDLGREIMSSHIDMAEESFNKIRSLLAEVENPNQLDAKTMIAQAEYNVCLKIIQKIQARINKFKKYDNLE
jgi:hypothetical protein